MPVYKTYFKILRKLRTPLLIYTFMFIGLAYAMTANSSMGSEEYHTEKINTIIINEDGQNTLVDGFLNYLDQYVTVVEPGKNEDSIKDALFFGEAKYILTIPKGFSDSFLNNGSLKLSKEALPDSAEAMSLNTVIDNYFNLARVYLSNVPEINYDKLNSYIEANLSIEAKTVFDVEKKDSVTNANEFNEEYFNFMGYVIIAAFITGISMIMFSFNGLDIRRRHNASPISYRRMNLQLILANLIFVFGYLLLFILSGLILSKSRSITINLVLTWVNAAVFALTVLSVSYLIGIAVNSRKAIGALSTGLSLGVAFLSGMFVPQEYLGDKVLRAASFTPAYWYVKANHSLMSIPSFQWSEVSEAFRCMAIEIGFTIAFISLALVVSKRKRQQSV
jgi:ABC-2 type transport system permease protein